MDVCLLCLLCVVR